LDNFSVLLRRADVWKRGALFYRVMQRVGRSVRCFIARCGVSVARCAVLLLGARCRSRGALFYRSVRCVGRVVRRFIAWCGVLLRGAGFGQPKSSN